MVLRRWQTEKALTPGASYPLGITALAGSLSGPLPAEISVRSETHPVNKRARHEDEYTYKHRKPGATCQTWAVLEDSVGTRQRRYLPSLGTTKSR